MLRKRVCITLIATFLLLSTLSSASAATIGLDFGSQGIEYVFSANPEQILSTTGDHYTIDKTLYTGYTYDVELYHTNWSNQNKRIGVALYNPNSSTATITVNAKAIGNSAAGEVNELDVTPALVEQYALGQGATTISIPAYGYTFLMYQDVVNGKTVFGKSKIYTNISGVRARVFHGPQSVGASTVFGYSRDTAYAPNLTTAFFNYDGKFNNTTIDASTYPTFKLSEWQPSLNTNEYYPYGGDVLGSNKLGGNYGVTYTINIKNGANKRLKITPYFSTAPAAAIVLWTPQYGWFRTDKLVNDNDGDPNDQYWLMSLGTTNDFTFKYILPGGNYGNMKFEVIN